MKKYSKIIGMVVGLGVGLLVKFGLVSADVDIPALQDSIMYILGVIGVYSAPANA